MLSPVALSVVLVLLLWDGVGGIVAGGLVLLISAVRLDVILDVMLVVPARCGGA